MKSSYDAIVAGGGFFGVSIASYLKQKGMSVLLCELQDGLMQRASYANQARVHNGYHYPRSFLTAVRSRINCNRFAADFNNCIVNSFEKYYAIPYQFSNVTANQFYSFSQRIQAPIKRAPSSILKLFDNQLIEDVFQVTEYAFDAVKLRDIVVNQMIDLGVDIATQTEVTSVKPFPQEKLRVVCAKNGVTETIEAKYLFNCTYSQINKLLRKSALPLVNFKYEIAEMALVEVPEEMKNIGITVMCGPFFSCMPFPSKKLHTLSHVRYTPHLTWYSNEDQMSDSYKRLDNYPKKSSFKHMQYDAQRYMPLLKECRYQSSLWEVKTLLPKTEFDDSRPILLRRDHGIEGFHCVLGGKIDNIYDIIDSLKN